MPANRRRAGQSPARRPSSARSSGRIQLDIINGGSTLSSVGMFVHFVPAPGAAGLLMGAGLLAARRRRA